MFYNAKEAIDYIEHIKRSEKRKDLSRMKKALLMLDNPQACYKKVHIAGTNGKGSTTSTLAKLLMANGYKVGKFVSPYVIKFNERIQVNDEFISDDDLVRIANIVKEIADDILNKENEVITFFEFVTLIGFVYFKEQKVDYALIEVGVGGRLDATNVISDALCLITNIGYDHTNSLGNTLEEIASHKLGIVKQNNQLITTVKSELIPYFNQSLMGITSNITFLNPKVIDVSLNGTTLMFDNEIYHTSLIGTFQAYNTALAIKAFKVLCPDVSKKVIDEALKTVSWPGRLEVISKKPYILIDGAHNIDGIKELTKSIKALNFKGKITTIFTALKDKDYNNMIKELEKCSSQFIFTTIDDSRASNARDLSLCTNKINFIEDNFDGAIKKALSLSKNDDMILITGSLHFISYVIKTLRK